LANKKNNLQASLESENRSTQANVDIKFVDKRKNKGRNKKDWVRRTFDLSLESMDLLDQVIATYSRHDDVIYKGDIINLAIKEICKVMLANSESEFIVSVRSNKRK
jgi:hypothetical protein